MKIYENLKKSMKIDEIPAKSMKVYENPRKSMQIYISLWKFVKTHEHIYQIHANLCNIFVLKKEDGLYSIFYEDICLTCLSSTEE